jgi:hypothetical protein
MDVKIGLRNVQYHDYTMEMCSRNQIGTSKQLATADQLLVQGLSYQ